MSYPRTKNQDLVVDKLWVTIEKGISKKTVKFLTDRFIGKKIHTVSSLE